MSSDEVAAGPSHPGALPSGVVTFVFTDVVGSTKLWETAPEAMGVAMVRHDEIIEAVVAQAGGQLVRPRGEGDSRFAVFSSPASAVQAAVDIVRRLEHEPWLTPTPILVRVAAHTGEADLRAGDYYGDPVNRCARMRSVAHPSQVVISSVTAGLAQTGLPDGVTLLDLGEHRLKDLTRAEQIWQVNHPDLPAQFPPLQSLNRVRHNLPIQLSSFIGRTATITQLCDLVRVQRLVTITGFGGMGKTRLALQVGAELADGDGDGVWFVDLADVRDEALIPEAVTRALGVAAGSDPFTSLVAHLTDKRLLLILDNLEQLLPQGARSIAALAAAGPGVRILGTSREALGLRGEHLYPLLPLAAPAEIASVTAAAVEDFDSVRLFADRASSADPRFTLNDTTAPAVAAICAQLDGWPLAIELAAARVKMLGTSGVLMRLSDRLGFLTSGARDLPDRQRTVRETIAWSFDLLSVQEQTLLARMSVFAGGATLTSIEEVCGTDLSGDCLDLVSTMADKSLLATDAGTDDVRLRLLTPIRAFAAEQLAAAGETDTVALRAAEHFSAVFATSQHGPKVGRSFLSEVPNILASADRLTWADPDAAALLLVHTGLRMKSLGAGPSLIAAADRLDSHPGLSAEARAALTVMQGVVKYESGVRPVDASAAAELLLAARGRQEEAFMGCALMTNLLAETGEHGTALVWAERAIAVSRWSDPPYRLGYSLGGFAYVADTAGDHNKAAEYALQAIEHERGEHGDPTQLAMALDAYCRILVNAGKGQEALLAGRQAVALRTGDDGMSAFCLGGLGRALLLTGHVIDASFVLTKELTRMAELNSGAPELGWLAVALTATHPEIAAQLMGANHRQYAETESKGLVPPPELLDPARRQLEAEHSDRITLGEQQGWPKVGQLLLGLDLPCSPDIADLLA